MKITEFRGPGWGSNGRVGGRVWVLGDLHSIFSCDVNIIREIALFDATSKVSQCNTRDIFAYIIIDLSVNIFLLTSLNICFGCSNQCQTVWIQIRPV